MTEWENAVSGICSECGLTTVIVDGLCIHCTRWQAQLDEARGHVEALLYSTKRTTARVAARRWLEAQDDDGE